jgi:hypothetical protein
MTSEELCQDEVKEVSQIISRYWYVVRSDSSPYAMYGPFKTKRDAMICFVASGHKEGYHAYRTGSHSYVVKGDALRNWF